MPTAIIVGGGVAGLTAALAFNHFGWTAQILERTGRLQEVGAGLQISPNGMKVFRALGLEAAISEIAFRPEALELRLGRTGRSIFRIPVADAAEARWGAPYLHVHRADLIDVLSAAVSTRLQDAVRLSTDVTGYTTAEHAASVTCANGDMVTGDIVIGADGIHSAIQAQMLGPTPPRFTGNVAWRATVPMHRLGGDAPPPTACVWAGAGRHAVTYRLRGGTLANFVGVVERSDWTKESWTEAGSRADALKDFEGWHPVITRLIDAADTHYRWALFDRAPLPRWTDGRVCLIGDAAHPTLPFMAQGAVMAIEDAYVLARLCATPATPPALALDTFFKQRVARTSKVQAASRANMATFHKRGGAAQALTYGPMWLAGRLAPEIVRGRQDVFYGHDVTA